MTKSDFDELIPKHSRPAPPDSVIAKPIDYQEFLCTHCNLYFPVAIPVVFGEMVFVRCPSCLDEMTTERIQDTTAEQFEVFEFDFPISEEYKQHLIDTLTAQSAQLEFDFDGM